MESMGKMLLVFGVIISIIGAILSLGGRIGLGKLPGDIFFQKGNFTFYFPIVTSIIISIVLTVLLNIIFRR